MNREQRIKDLLQPLKPLQFELINNSAQHASHVKKLGREPSGDTHFKLRLMSEAFATLSRIERQRRVMDLLAAEFKSGLHALEMRLLAPDET
jgi:stress-induced morphogen